MRVTAIHSVPLAVAAVLCAAAPGAAAAAKLTLELGNARTVTAVGAVQRWDADGNARRPTDTKAKIDAPRFDAKAVNVEAGRWVFSALPPGKYDLVVLAKGRVRVEGFCYPPVGEFDPFLRPDAAVEEETRKTIVGMIEKSAHYENKVGLLYLAGDKKEVRALVMLIRDKPTSYEAELPGAATIRHEIWQFSWRYGGWLKEKRTRVLDRLILPRGELRKWTWLWAPSLVAST